MSSTWRVRGYEPRDLGGVRRVLDRTILLGQPLPFPVLDLDLLVDYFTGFYLEHEPQACRVVVDAADEVVGYLLGTTQPAAQAAWQRRAALRLAARWAVRWRHYDPFTRWFYRLRLRDAWEVLANPDPPLPAHCHWHLLPAVRGRFGRELGLWFLHYVQDCGLPAFGGEYPLPVRRKDASLFKRIGATVVHQVPHHTLSALLGEPVLRITLHIKSDEGHW
ncbi:MAG: hypothetical protein IT204_06750 [Fimbriimonadaceae bacterium]|nr:hypothetical protein [Fimbriimonadaceae bacterium]